MVVVIALAANTAVPNLTRSIKLILPIHPHDIVLLWVKYYRLEGYFALKSQSNITDMRKQVAYQYLSIASIVKQIGNIRHSQNLVLCKQS